MSMTREELEALGLKDPSKQIDDSEEMAALAESLNQKVELIEALQRAETAETELVQLQTGYNALHGEARAWKATALDMERNRDEAQAEAQRLRSGIEALASLCDRHADTVQQASVTWPGKSITIDTARGAVEEIRTEARNLLTTTEQAP
jgi:uncharacterized membrane protein YqiK